MRLSVSHSLESSSARYSLLIDFYLRAVRIYSALYSNLSQHNGGGFVGTSTTSVTKGDLVNLAEFPG